MLRDKGGLPSASEFQDSATVLAELDRILSTPLFQHSKRYPRFLRYVVEQTLHGASDELKERTLGIAVFGRSPDYDTSADPVVRTTASEVRKRLEEYYSNAGREDELRITLPTGGYLPEFRYSAENGCHVSKESKVAPIARARQWRKWAVGFSLIAALGGLLVGMELFPR